MQKTNNKNLYFTTFYNFLGLFKIILLFAIAFANVVFANVDEENKFQEKNLPDVRLKVEEEKKDTIKAENIKEGVDDILLNKKISSLMFSKEDIVKIDKLVYAIENKSSYQEGEEEKKENAAENIKSYLYLGSIIYFTPKDWIVWINENKITSETNKAQNEIYIRAIEKDKVSVLWKLSVNKWKILINPKPNEKIPATNENDEIEVFFELKTNQTFILKANKIVEGRPIVALSTREKKDQNDNLENAQNKKNEPSKKDDKQNLDSSIQEIDLYE